jgi:CreA protein
VLSNFPPALGTPTSAMRKRAVTRLPALGVNIGPNWPVECATRLPAMQRDQQITSPGAWSAHNGAMKNLLFVTVLTAAFAAQAQRIGEVDTVFKFIGPDHKIVVDAYDDPEVKGVTCYVSRAKTGGIRGGLGLAEDKAEASIACRQTGPIAFPKPIKLEDEMFSERISLVFKRLRVVRMVDATRNTLVYLTYSDRVIEGSPQNSVTAVPVDRSTPIPLR